MTVLLSNFELENVSKVVEKFMMQNRFFPDISEFFTELNPQTSIDDEAIILANEVLQFCANTSPQISEAEIKKSVGDDGFKLINAFGLSSLIRAEYSQIPSIRAQLRETAKSMKRVESHDTLATSKEKVIVDEARRISGGVDL